MRDGLTVLRIDRPSEPVGLQRPSGWLAWSTAGRQLASLAIDAQKRLHLNVFAADGWRGSPRPRRIMAVDGDGYDQSVSELVWLPYARRFAFVLHTVTAKSTRRAYHTRPDLYVVSADGSDDRKHERPEAT